MTCRVIPFPTVRRVRFIKKVASLMVKYSPEGGERTLTAKLNTLYDIMLRQGIEPKVIERELRSLELAIRARLWVIVMQGGDAA